MNPYRTAERAFIGLVGLLIMAVLAALGWLITITESWKGVGVTVLVLVGWFGLAILHEEWGSVEGWWRRKREAWDSKHPSASREHE